MQSKAPAHLLTDISAVIQSISEPCLQRNLHVKSDSLDLYFDDEMLAQSESEDEDNYDPNVFKYLVENSRSVNVEVSQLLINLGLWLPPNTFSDALFSKFAAQINSELMECRLPR